MSIAKITFNWSFRDCCKIHLDKGPVKELYGKKYQVISLKNKPWEICKRIFCITSVAFASLLVLPIVFFVVCGTYRKACKSAFELAHRNIIEFEIVAKEQPISSSEKEQYKFSDKRYIPADITIKALDEFLNHEGLHKCLEEVIKSKPNLSADYPEAYINFLMWHYFQKSAGSSAHSLGFYMNKNGEVDGCQDTSNKILYAFNFNLYSRDRPYASLNIGELKSMLGHELETHPKQRPMKIFIPCLLNKPGKPAMSVALVIEPDLFEINKANITLLTPYGISNDEYKQEKQIILEAVKRVYDHEKTSIFENIKGTTETPYTTVDCIDNFRHLSSVEDIQKHVKQGNQPFKDAQTISQKFLVHVDEAIRFLNKVD